MFSLKYEKYFLRELHINIQMGANARDYLYDVQVSREIFPIF